MNRLQTLTLRMKRVLTVLPAALLIGLGVLLSVLPQPVQANSSSLPEYIPSIGKDFWLTYMLNFAKEDATDENLQLEVVALPSASGTISITCCDGTPLVTSAALTAGVPYTYQIPEDKREKVYNTTSATIANTGLHVETSVDVTLYMRNLYWSGGMSNDASTVIATPSLGTEYVVQTFSRDMEHTEFVIVATQDGTHITVEFSNDMALKPDKTSTFSGAELTQTITLNKGQTYQILGKRRTVNAYLSGTKISGDKPFAVFNGGEKSTVPYTVHNGDHMMEQNIPISSWGKRFVVAPMHGIPAGSWTIPEEKATHIIVGAIYDETEVYVNGSSTPWVTLSAGQTSAYSGSKLISLKYGDAPKIIETSKPVLVYSYMPTIMTVVNPSEEEYQYGEPSNALIADVNKGVNEVQIYCWDDPLDLHYANVVVRQDAVAGMRLTNANGANQDISGQFTVMDKTFSGYAQYYASARLNLANGLNTLTNATGKFVATYYSIGESATSEASATVFNLAPIAPVVKIDGVEVAHNASMDYCNKHPGIEFSAIVDYPHTSVKWDLGEGAVSTGYSASHMYGATVGESDATHNIWFYVYRESPITHIKDTDTVHVTLNVHPVYYDTLKTKVAANKLE